MTVKQLTKLSVTNARFDFGKGGGGCQIGQRWRKKSSSFWPPAEVLRGKKEKETLTSASWDCASRMLCEVGPIVVKERSNVSLNDRSLATKVEEGPEPKIMHMNALHPSEIPSEEEH